MSVWIRRLFLPDRRYVDPQYGIRTHSVCVGNTTTKCRYRRVFSHIHHTTAPLAHTLSRVEYVDDFFGRFAQRDNATHQSNPQVGILLVYPHRYGYQGESQRQSIRARAHRRPLIEHTSEQYKTAARPARFPHGASAGGNNEGISCRRCRVGR